MSFESFTPIFNPEVDFADSPAHLQIYNMFRNGIIYTIDMCQHIEHITPPNVYQHFLQEPFVYLQRLIYGSIYANPDEVVALINNQVFNGEQVLFNDETALKESDFFLTLCDIVQYIGIDPNIQQRINELENRMRNHRPPNADGFLIRRDSL